MRHRAASSIGALALAALAIVWLSPADVEAQAGRAAGKSWTAAKTPWGDPDLQGTWTNTTTTPFERPADLQGKEVLTDAELETRDREVAARVSFDNKPRPGNPGGYNEFWVERGRLSKQTSLVIDPPDGRVPALTPEAQKRVQDRAAWRKEHPADSWEDTGLFTRCLTRGMPSGMIPGFYNHNYQIFQSPGWVAIHLEMIHETRLVPVDGRSHVGSNIRQWMGDGRGRWEGNTLVVETTNFTDKSEFRGTGANLRLVERFTRVGPDAIDYQFTVDDPTVFTRPWTASIPMSALDERIFEYACHEGNYGIHNILAGHREEERAAQQSRSR
jgi:hypothetical protein